jgi:hypothetical protein
MIPAQYFDFLGLISFSVLLYLGIRLRKKDTAASIILFIIGISGLIIDSYSVITNFLGWF